MAKKKKKKTTPSEELKIMWKARQRKESGTSLRFQAPDTKNKMVPVREIRTKSR